MPCSGSLCFQEHLLNGPCRTFALNSSRHSYWALSSALLPSLTPAHNPLLCPQRDAAPLAVARPARRPANSPARPPPAPSAFDRARRPSFVGVPQPGRLKSRLPVHSSSSTPRPSQRVAWSRPLWISTRPAHDNRSALSLC
ncbi:hypothetical protein BS50DRAFT_339236 [Corynespora cassiicola Philippines]|uniref:Uncharacterized protein n=1 Tax=Corynespora cassiicola Philippines TaxID=1448308 RepID=A0A2T2NV38_CORCC|nr:hypothetical protein BS50DRAFT_339236 [Corynespora cassiicola Philippines]